MTTTMVAIQLIGLIAMAIDVYATLHKSDKKLIRIHSLGSLLFSLHYFLLGAIPGALSELLNGTRTGLAAFTQSKYLAVAFLSIYMVLLFLIPQKPIEMLPFISSILITVGLYFFKNIQMRLFYVAGFSFWFIYSIYVLSIGGIILFTVLLTTSALTIFRIIRDQS